jgi:hypothetical protein
MLITIAEAALLLNNVPVKPLAATALAHGFIVRIGSSQYLVKAELEGLIEKCRCQPKDQDYSHASDPVETLHGLLKTPAVSRSAHAQATAAKLKSNSANTSRARTAQVVLLDRKK